MCRAVATPYLYTEADVAALMEAARALHPSLRAATYETLVGLMAVTSMRVGEAIRLDRDGLDWTSGLLTVRESKLASPARYRCTSARSRRSPPIRCCATTFVLGR